MFSFTRFKIRLQMADILNFQGDKASYRSEQVRDVLQHWLDGMGEVDSDVAFMPWSESSEEKLPPRFPTPPKTSPPTPHKPLPTHKDFAAPYFYAINYYTRSSELFFYVRVRHTQSREVLMNVSTRGQLTVYVAYLQQGENPIKGGFFVYSNRAFASSSVLQNAVQHYVNFTAKKTIEIALYWAPVNMASFNLGGCQALNIDVDESDYFLLKRILTQLYNREKLYPAHLPMAYVPPVSRCVDKGLLKAACDSQLKYLEAYNWYEFRCFKQTDLLAPIPLRPELSEDGIKEATTTLWELFNQVKVDSVRVFHSVLECEDRRGVYIQAVVMPLPSPCRDLAKTVHTSPVAFFRQFFIEETLEELFVNSAIIQGHSETYDPVARKVTNTDESTAMESISTFWHIDIKAVLDNLTKVQQQVHPPQRDAASGDSSYQGSTFSFNPGSVVTTSALKKARFEAPAPSQVPGTSMDGVSGERP